MASVAAAIATECASGSAWSCDLLDSGGGAGRRGYGRFPASLVAVGRRDYDVLHLHVASKGSTLRKAVMARVARRRSLPYVIHLHGAGYVDFLDRCGPRALAAVQRFYAEAARVIVLGRQWHDLVENRLRVPPERIITVPNGVSPVLLDDRPDVGLNTTVLAVGELSHRKGVDLLLTALATVLRQERFGQVRAALVGTTPDERILTFARALSQELDGRVEVTGPLFGADKRHRFASAAVLCLPSRAEALPMTLLEAMSAGVPCITTDVGSIGEIFPEGSRSGAIVLPEPDAPALATALEGLLADPEKRRAMGAAGRTRWESTYTAAAMTGRIQETWQAAISDSSTA